MSFGKRGAATQTAGQRLQPQGTTSPRLAAAVGSAPVQQAAGKTEKFPGANAGTLGDALKVVAFCLLCCSALAWFHMGELLRDRSLAGTFVVDHTVTVESGKCRSMIWLLSTCDVRLSYKHEAGAMHSVHSETIYGLGSMGGKAIIPVRSTVDPDAVSITASAVDYLTNRTVTFTLLFGVMALLSLHLSATIIKGRYIGGRAWVAQYGQPPL